MSDVHPAGRARLGRHRFPHRSHGTHPGLVLSAALVPLVLLGSGTLVALQQSGGEASPASAPVAATSARLRQPAPRDVPAPLTAHLPVIRDAALAADLPARVGAEYAGGAAGRTAAASGVSAADIHAVLARRTSALRARNEKAFLATFDPSRPQLVATERTLFRNLVKLPLVNPSYLESGITGSATSRRSYVSLIHQLRGVDAEPTELSKVEQWTRRGSAVVTTAVSPVPGTPATRYAPLDQVPLTVVNGRQVTVAGTGDVKNLAQIAATAERAATAVRQLWGTRSGPSRFVLLVTHDKRAVGTWFGSSDAPFTASGATLMQVSVRHLTRFAGARVIVDLNQTSTADLLRVLRHEFTHAEDVQAQSVPAAGVTQNYPTWAEEGFAAWVEELDLPLARSLYASVVKSLRSSWNHRLPPADRAGFYVDGERGAYNYGTAALVYRYIATRWGTAKAVSFYAATAGGHSAAAYALLGTDQAGFTGAWAGWVDGLLGA